MTTVLLAGGGTGGHLMPALAIAEAIRREHADWRFFFAGAERGIEARVLPERGMPHQLLPLEPIYRQQWWKNLRWPLLLPRLIHRIDALLDAEQPAVVIGTGGYVSGPVVWRATRRGIPAAILELDVQPGTATRLLASRVREIYLAAPETAPAFAGRLQSRILVTGAPITPPDRVRRPAAMVRFGVTGDRPVIVVTGGSQGSLAINRVIAEWVRCGGSAGVQLIWATGRASHAEFAALHQPPAIHVIPFIDPMADAWSVASLCIARSGMMTLAELCAWGIPAILVPLPTAAADHQTHNAAAMASAGAAVVLGQSGLSAESLGRTIGGLLGDQEGLAQMASRATLRGAPDAAATIARHVVQLALSDRRS